MIRVFGAPPTRALRVVWMLEELGQDYEIRPVDFATRFKDAEFMAIQPAGILPAITDGDVSLFESCAIIEYLGRKYGPTPLCPRPDHPDWPRYLQFMHFGEASLAAPLNVTVGSKFMAPEGEQENWGSRLAVDLAVGRSRALVKQLKKTPYIAGETFTAADISVSYFMLFKDMFGFADRLDPVLLDYWERLEARDAYQRAKAKAQPALPKSS